MDHLADRLDQAADILATVDRGLSALAVPAAVFGAEEVGLPGRLGRELHAHWAAVLDARAHEASTAASRLAEMAGSVRATSRHYTETDEAVHRRLLREM
jgi:hypothetical protein